MNLHCKTWTKTSITASRAMQKKKQFSVSRTEGKQLVYTLKTYKENGNVKYIQNLLKNCFYHSMPVSVVSCNII